MFLMCTYLNHSETSAAEKLTQWIETPRIPCLRPTMNDHDQRRRQHGWLCWHLWLSGQIAHDLFSVCGFYMKWINTSQIIFCHLRPLGLDYFYFPFGFCRALHAIFIDNSSSGEKKEGRWAPWKMEQPTSF